MSYQLKVIESIRDLYQFAMYVFKHKMNSLWMLPLWMFCCFSQFTNAQNIQIETVSKDFDLDPLNITCLLQDQKGFIWLGTWNGLYRFDGYEFVHHKIGFVNHVMEDQKGFLWVSTATGLACLDPRTETIHKFLHDPDDPHSLSNNYVGSTLEDAAGNFWVGPRMVLEKMDRETGQFQHFPVPIDPADHPNKSFEITDIVDMGDYLHFFPNEGKIWRFHKKTGTFEVLASERQEVRKVYSFSFDHDGNPMALDGGILVYSPTDNKYCNIMGSRPFLLDVWLKCAAPLKSGGYLAGISDYGVVEYDRSFNPVGHYLLNDKNQKSEAENVETIIQGQGGEVWIGAASSGLYKYDPFQKKFKVYVHRENDDNSLGDSNVRNVMEANDGKIWIATRTAGISIFDPATKQFSRLQNRPNDPQSLTSNETRQLLQDSQGRTWVGTWGFGIDVLDENNRKLFHFAERLDDPTSLSGDFIMSFCESKDGHIWIGTINGASAIQVDDVESGVFSNHRFTVKEDGEGAPLRVTKVFCDHAGQMWLGTELGGLKLYQPSTNSFRTFKNDPNDPFSLTANSVQSIFQDSKNRLWVGAVGLNLYVPDKEHFINNKYENLRNEGIVAGIEDREGNLWLVLYKGLVKFDPDQNTFRNYTTKDGLPTDNFISSMPQASCRDGSFYLGDRNGLVVFHPDSIFANRHVPPVYVTAFKKYRIEGAETVSENIPGITEKKQVDLSHRENTFTVLFSALNYRNTKKNQYAYKLEGLGDNWINIGTRRELTFSNLSPGNYVLHLKAANNDGLWSEGSRALAIHIAPPWWRTWWAYLSYGLLLVSMAYAFYRFQLNRQLERTEAERLKELNTLKTRLYTNITHEFRTPLTVIMGITEQLTGGSWQSRVGKEDHQMLSRNFSLIQRNSKNLLRLINQLLDLSKLDSGTMKMDNVTADIISYLQYLTESFYSMAKEKDIRLVFYPEMKKLVMDFDEVKMQHIIYNLLSNAIKYTERGGKIVFHAKQEVRDGKPTLLLVVSDTGTGIPSEKLPFIFDRFYQVDGTSTRKGEGTGIGLALTKELVELMDGSITAESSIGEGTVFTISLPIKESSKTTSFSLTAPLVTNWQAPVEPRTSSLELPSLLLIEDNRDVATYISQILEKDYRIEFAPDGQAGIDKALELIPDLIISDVMMPEKNGFEVCEILKNDERTSHIPIVLLTAKATDADKIAGLKTGADAYLMKPFNKEELFVRLENLLEIRRKLQERYATWTLPPTASASGEKPATEQSSPANFTPAEPSLEDLFLQKIQKAVEEKLDDSSLTVGQLSQAVGLSESQLFRKLKALTGHSPNTFVRKIRLQRGMDLLNNSDLNISEIAYSVGFNDPNYFSRVFQKEFGNPPSYYLK